MEDYIEDIKLTYPECSIVKDPFMNAIGRSIGLPDLSRFWSDAKLIKGKIRRFYRLTFNSYDRPMAMPYVLFSHDINGNGHQVELVIGKSVMQQLEDLALNGYTLFVSNSIRIVKNIVWRPYWSKEQMLVDLDLKGEFVL